MNTSTNQIIFEDWGEIDYLVSTQKQLDYIEEIAQGLRRDTIVFCSHPAIVTLGRGTKANDVFSWQGPTIEVSRGGRATYHGPSQVVIYPLINLSVSSRAELKPKDVGHYLRLLEQAIILTLAEYNISAEGKSLHKKYNSEYDTEETGVWVENKKIASLGIAVKKWVTYHGAALNVEYDPNAFQGLNPCGFKSDVMVSLEQLLNHKKLDKKSITEKLKFYLIKKFS